MATDLRAIATRGELTSTGGDDLTAKGSHGQLVGALSLPVVTDLRALATRGKLSNIGVGDVSAMGTHGQFADVRPIDLRSVATRGKLSMYGGDDLLAAGTHGMMSSSYSYSGPTDVDVAASGSAGGTGTATVVATPADTHVPASGVAGGTGAATVQVSLPVPGSGTAGGTGQATLNLDTSAPTTPGTCYFQFRHFQSIGPGGTAVLIGTHSITVPTGDMSNLVQVSAGVYRFMVRAANGTDWLLCSYTAGDNGYTVIHTFGPSDGTALPTGFSDAHMGLPVWGDGARIDQYFYRTAAGAYYWFRHCAAAAGDPRIAAFVLTDTTCTLQSDVLPARNQFDNIQAWGEYSASPLLLVGDVGGNYDGGGGSPATDRWTPGAFAMQGQTFAPYPAGRRWYVDRPGSTPLIAGYTSSTDWGGCFVMEPLIHGTEIAVEGDAGGTGDAEIESLHTDIAVEGSSGGTGAAVVSAVVPGQTQIPAPGSAGGTGQAMVGSGTSIGVDGTAGGSGEATVVADAAVQPGGGYSGGEIALKSPTSGNQRIWEWTGARPPAYDRSANRAFGAAVGGVASHSTPHFNTPLDPTNPLSQYVIYCSWFSGQGD
jgi:hypothetical protein